MILFIGFFLFVISLLVSIQLFLALAFLFIPTLVIFFILMLLGVSITFWKLYLIVFCVMFVVNLLKD